MIPIKLIIEDFLCYSRAEIDFDEFSSAVIIAKKTGNDKISNGAGKSTIFSAIKYALFNRVDSSTLDQVIRHNTNLCRVSFDFMVDNITYRIIRCKPKGTSTDIRLFILNQNIWDEITNKTPTQTEAEIGKIIKINYETFCNSVIFSHRDLFFGLASLRPADKKKALKEALQLNIYNKFEKTASKKASDIVKEIEKTRTIIGVLGEPEKDIIALNNDLAGISSSMLNYNNEKIDLNKAYDYENEIYATSVARFDEIEKISMDARARQKTLKADIAKLNEIVKDYANKLTTLKKSGSAISNEIEEIKSYINKHAHARSSKNELEEILAVILDMTTKKQTLSSKLFELEIPLPDDSVCKHCRQTLSDEHRLLCKEEINKEILIIRDSLKNITEDLENIRVNELSIKKKIAEEEKIVSDIKQKNSLLELKIKELENKRTLYQEYIDLSNQNISILEEKTNELDTIQKAQSIERIVEHAKLKTTIPEIKERLVSLSKELDGLTERILSCSNTKAVLEHKKNERTKDIEKIVSFNNDILSLEAKYGLHQKVIQAFGSGGIPALIIHTILDDFQIETNNLLSQLRPGLQVQFSVVKERGDGDKDDTLDITYALNGKDLEYALLSQAQKLLVSLCLKLGLASVIKKRLGTDIKLFMVDEADQSLDSESLDLFEAAIKKLQQDFKILIITHNNDLKEKFSHTILVEQDENMISTAKVVAL